VIKTAATQIPLSIAEIDAYLQKFGPPPYFSQLAGRLEKSYLDHETSSFEAKFKYDANADYPTILRFSKKVFL